MNRIFFFLLISALGINAEETATISTASVLNQSSLSITNTNSLSEFTENTEVIKELISLAKNYKDENEKGISSEEKESRAKIRKRISEILDMKEMAHLILKNYWDKLKPEEREKYTNLWIKLMEKIGYPQIADYFNKKIEIEYVGEKKQGENTIVQTKIIYHDEDLILNTEFYMHKIKTDPAIYDVITDGDSLLLIYRNQHMQIIKEKGFSELIRLMNKKLNLDKKQ